MLEIGEKASNLPEQLRLLRDLYEEETERQIDFFYRLRGRGEQNRDVSVIATIYIGTYMPIILAGPKMMNSGN